MSGDPPREQLLPALERARALKDRCYGAWHTDPAVAVRAADDLEALRAAHATDPDAVAITALADWTGAIAAISTGDLTAAVDLLDRAHAGLTARGLARDAAETRIPKIMALALLGRFAAAEDCAIAARDTLLALGDLGSAARVVLNMGSLCYSQDRYAEAAGHYQHASSWFARAGDREHSVLADIARGDTCSFLGDLDEAEALYRRAAQRASAHALHVIAATASQALAELELVRGNYHAALAGLEAARREFSTLGLPLLERQAERALADTYLEINLLDEADATYARIAETEADESAATAWLWVQRARIAVTRRADAVADTALARAAWFFERMDNDVGRAEVALARSTLAMNAGHWETARALAADARTRLVALELPAEHAVLAVAVADTRRGAAEAALGQLEGLLEDPSTPLPVRERAWLWQGRALIARGKPDFARRSFERAVELAEAGLAKLPSDDVQRGYLDTRAGAYEELLRLALAESTGQRDDATAVAILAALERLRARTLVIALALPGWSEPGAGDAAARDERERLDWIYRRISRHVREETDEPPPAGLERERQSLEQRMLERYRNAKFARPESIATASRDEFDPAAVAASLADDDAVVAYGRLDDEVFAISLHQGRFRLHRGLTTLQAVYEAQAALRLQLDTYRLGATHLGRHHSLLVDRARRCLGRLHELLWQSIAPALGNAGFVRIVPCAEFGALPFAALWDGTCYLAERFATTRLASLATAIGRPVPRVPERALLMADTTRLAGSGVELIGLAAIWPEHRLIGGSDMTRDALQQAAPGADLIHLACHGEFRADSPRFSALHLFDGAFTALELESWALAQSPIVVLAACDSGVTDVGRGDEYLGLVRAFLVAGASRVIAALWAVDDGRTAELMLAVHGALRDPAHRTAAGGRWVSAALTAIQRDYIARGAHPYDWAGFTLNGGA